MPESLLALLIGTALASLIGDRYWAGRQRADRQPTKIDQAERHCVWCLYRRGDLCTHPGSPVYPDHCTLVCVGRMDCEARVVKRRGGRS